MFQMFKLDFKKGRGSRHQIANIHWSIEKAGEFQENIYFGFIDNAKAFDCEDHSKLWKIFKQMGMTGHLTCLLRNLCAGQEATVRTRHGTKDWSKIGKGLYQGCMLSPCLFHDYAEYIMQKAGRDEAQAGIKIAGRNITNFSYTDDTTLLAETEEELRSLLIREREDNEESGLKLNIHKTRVTASSPSTSWPVDGEKWKH